MTVAGEGISLDLFAELAASIPLQASSPIYASSSDHSPLSDTSQDSDTGSDEELSEALRRERSVHSQNERQRRGNLRSAFGILKARVSVSMDGRRATKMEVLKSAAERIIRLKKEVMLLEKEYARRRELAHTSN